MARQERTKDRKYQITGHTQCMQCIVYLLCEVFYGLCKGSHAPHGCPNQNASAHLVHIVYVFLLYGYTSSL